MAAAAGAALASGMLGSKGKAAADALGLGGGGGGSGGKAAGNEELNLTNRLYHTFHSYGNCCWSHGGERWRRSQEEV